MGQRDIDKLKPSDRPYTANYPELEKWLHDHEGRCMSQDAIGEDFLEKWSVAGRVVLIEIRARKRGWEIWTSFGENDVGRTLADAERRLGIRPKEA